MEGHNQSMAWDPDAHKQQRALEAPYFDVPPHLRAGLLDWISSFWRNPQILASYMVHFRMNGPDPHTSPGQAISYLDNFVRDNPTHLLDGINFILSRGNPHPVARLSLGGLLKNANSAYQLNTDRTALEFRVAPEVKSAAIEAISASTATSAHEHLTEAWNCAYSLSPDPVKAYSESIKAVEAAAAPHISPINTKQTLGTMHRNINEKPQKWVTLLWSAPGEGATAVRYAMQMLWEGQSSRHGGTGPTVPETLEQARFAVQLAVFLVYAFSTGAIRRDTTT
jgi:hypothetical protein